MLPEQEINVFDCISISINRSNVYGIKGEMIIKIYKRLFLMNDETKKFVKEMSFVASFIWKAT